MAPRDGYQFHDERTAGIFTVQRWVSAAAPEVSPAGMCECLTVVYRGDQQVLTIGTPNDLSATLLQPASGLDINGDGQPDLVVSTWSGGAHCCFSTTAYSFGSEPRTLLSLNSGNCGGEFADLDGDGVLEFSTCDDRWAYAHCAFALSPMPTVVFAYDAMRRTYVPATPRFGELFRDRVNAQLKDLEKLRTDGAARDVEMDKCAVLSPVLELMYSGRFDEGVAALREFYREDDLKEFEDLTVRTVHESPFWTAR